MDNALVENLTMVEGAVAVARELSELDGPLAVGGEGLYEMTMRHQSFAQAHLFNSHHHNCPYLAELDPVPVGDFLYGDLCKTMAYVNIDGETPETRLRLDIHEHWCNARCLAGDASEVGVLRTAMRNATPRRA